MSELDDFLRWTAQDPNNWVPYGTLQGAIDIFRAEKLTGRKFTRWVDAYAALTQEKK